MSFGARYVYLVMTSDAFEQLVRPFRRELAAHYRMLGSLQDAEDQVQETLLSAWRGIDGFEGRASMRSWLYKIATNRCLDEIRRRPRRGLPSEHGAPRDPLAPIEPVNELLWVEPCPPGLWETYAQRESVQLAFIVALQHLPATQRAVLILREVLGWSAAEVAELLDTTVPSVNSALQRARATIAHKPAVQGDVETIAARYIAAWEAGDIDSLVALLHDDVIVSMPPVPTWFRGADAARAFFGPKMVEPRRMLRVAGADTLMFASYRGMQPPYVGYAIQVLHVADNAITELHAFVDRALLPKFDVPLSLDR